MKAIRRLAFAALIGASLSVLGTGSASAQDVPTGAARLIEKVQTRIFISKSTLVFKVEAILANQPAVGGK